MADIYKDRNVYVDFVKAPVRRGAKEDTIQERVDQYLKLFKEKSDIDYLKNEMKELEPLDAYPLFLKAIGSDRSKTKKDFASRGGKKA